MVNWIKVLLACILFSGCSIGKFRAKDHFEKYKAGRYYWPSVEGTSYRGKYIEGMYESILKDVNGIIRPELNKRADEMDARISAMRPKLESAEKVNEDIAAKLKLTDDAYKRIGEFDNRITKNQEKSDALKEEIFTLRKELERLRTVLKTLGGL